MLPIVGEKKITNLYEKDFYAWTLLNAELLKQGNISEIDIEHIIEELESMGKSERRELTSRLIVLMMHLLKWKYQPERRGNSWRLTIEGQREDLLELLKDSPSLKNEVAVRHEDAYRRAIIDAAKQTGFSKKAFPSSCPFSIDQILDSEFWPD
ncbi:MAG: DUF29 domain-containing protein [Desulfobacterales bacterium]|nr:DUF29 domain-containing protein [Desulfobacterales bacterium]